MEALSKVGRFKVWCCGQFNLLDMTADAIDVMYFVGLGVSVSH